MTDQFARTAAGLAAAVSTGADSAEKLAATVSAATHTAVDKLRSLPNPRFDLTHLDLTARAAVDPRRLRSLSLPELDLDVVPDRVTKVVRDTAYAGLGAAVIAAQKVDAGVRRLAPRAA